jgi:hypothetical protein
MQIKAMVGSLVLLLGAAVLPAHAKCILPYVLANGEVPDAAQMMANFNALVACRAVAGSANAIQYNAGSGALGAVGPPTDGQLIIGATGAAPQAQTLTAGSGIAITNGAGSVSIAATTGTAGTGIYRQVMSATPTASSTGLSSWLNQGSSTVSDGTMGITIDSPSSAATNLTGRYKAAPTAPYTITVLVTATRNTLNGAFVGIGWYDGTAKVQPIGIFNNGSGLQLIAVRQYNTPTSSPGISFQSGLNGYSVPVWFQIRDDGTSVYFSFSYDGANFFQVYTTTKASGFLGASGYSNVIFLADPNAGRMFGTLLSWTQI